MMPAKPRYLLGIVCGALAAACYGMNPLGAVSLYREGFGTGTVLMFRFGFAAMMLAAFMLASRTSFALTRRELAVTSALLDEDKPSPASAASRESVAPAAPRGRAFVQDVLPGF